MSARDDLKRRARSDYVNRRMMQSTIAAAYSISEATVGRWKKAAKEAGDDWDLARRAHVIAGEGVEVVASAVIEDFFIQAQAVMANIRKSDGDPEKQVAMLASLADSTTKMAAASKRFAPKISELGVAQDVIAKFFDFVKVNFPQHAAVILEIIDPFGALLPEIYTT